MGKTTTPMRILLTSHTLAQHEDLAPIVKELTEQGHTITIDETLAQYHFIAGPNCWYCVPEVAGLFGLAVKQGRKIAAVEKKALPKKDKPIKKPAKAKKPKKQTLLPDELPA